jgi:DNA-binding XRE family transcriptional regulator
MIKKIFGARLKQMRIERNMSVETMCKMMNVKRQTIWNHETGNNVSLDTIEKYCQILNCKYKELLDIC